MLYNLGRVISLAIHMLVRMLSLGVSLPSYNSTHSTDFPNHARRTEMDDRSYLDSGMVECGY
jgi:hypothetical protein